MTRQFIDVEDEKMESIYYSQKWVVCYDGDVLRGKNTLFEIFLTQNFMNFMNFFVIYIYIYIYI